MHNPTFEKFCNEPAFPVYDDLAEHGVPASGYKGGGKNGITRLEHFAEQAMIVGIQDAYIKKMDLQSHYTSMHIAKDAYETATQTLRVLFAIRYPDA